MQDDSRAVVVDRAWAHRFFANGTAIGARFHEGGCTTCPWMSVVGVVSDGNVMRQLDASVPLTRAATIDELVARSLGIPRSLSLIVATFAIVC